MSRPALLKQVESSNIALSDPAFQKHSSGNAQIHVHMNGMVKNGDYAPKNKFQGPGLPENGKLRVEHDRRRASAGDERSATGSLQRPRRSIPNIVTDKTDRITGSKSQGPSPRQTGQRCNQNRCTNNKDSQTQYKDTKSADVDASRRKSLYDGRATLLWYSPETRPVSSDRCERSRRNVISPNTLSRISFNEREIGERGGSAKLHVCTEDDWKAYGSNLPNRRLVSHKRLNYNGGLPYSDNIGLEETVTSDQAKKAAKMKQYKEWKRQQKPSRQTPKQVWHRTVRSIPVANHLYHEIQRKNRKRNQ